MKKRGIRFFCLLLALLTVSSFFGCAEKGPEKEADPTSEPTANPTSEPTLEPTAEPTPTEAPALTMKELGTALASTPYAETGLRSDAVYGMTDNEVGVNRAQLESNEKKYPMPSDSEFAAIYDLSGEVSPSNTALKNSVAIKSALTKASSVTGKKKIILPNGEIPIPALLISNQTDLYICGSGNTTLKLSKWNTAVSITGCTNVYVSDLHITFDLPGMLTGKVVEASGRTVKVKIDEGFDLSCSNYDCVRGYYEMKKDPFGGDNYVLDISKNTRYWQGDSFAVTDAANRIITVTFATDPAYKTAKDTVVSLLLGCYTGGAAFTVSGSKNTTVQSVRMDTLPGMGLVSTYSENLYVDRLSITPDTSRGLHFATCWDGIHTVQLRGDFVLTNTQEYGIEDDCLNVCACWSYVQSVSGKKLTVKNNESDFRVGDTIEVYSSVNLTPKGKYTITAISGTTLTLDKDLQSGVCADDMVGNDTAATHLTVDNCYFANCLGHAGLIQCRDTVIKNSTFSNLTMGGMRVHCAIASFSEAIIPRNITIENCKFFDCGLGDGNFFSSMEIVAFVGAWNTSNGVLENVKIRENFVCNQRGGGVTLYGVSKATIENNFFYDINRNHVGYEGTIYNTAVSCAQGTENTIKNNCVWVADPASYYVVVKIDAKTTRKITEENNAYYHG